MKSALAYSTLTFLAAGVALSAAGIDIAAQETAETVQLDFEDGAIQRWNDIKLADRATRFTRTAEGDGAVLRADSDEAAAALWHRLDLPPRIDHTVTWRWKISHALRDNSDEREKKGDDYAARFFVIFDDEPFSKKARALCYVWASGEPVGAAYPNPYYSNVATIVLQSGAAKAGEWVTEERHFVEDYVDAFGQPPRSVTAVAVMVDTDNTKQAATAWFDKIIVRIRSRPSPNSGRRNRG